ncbi:MAG: RNA polymerase sigma factor [Candidatus Moranbacteria bacterium]|nr:RNA polymerase sigma factor [Candidatus Moranbacteria bacterium]
MKTQLQRKEARTCPCELSEFCGKRTDEEIIEFAKVNKECYALLVERYEAKLARYIKRISNPPKESVEDILQSVFLKVYENLNAFDSSNKFSSWIYRIAHNETVNFWRKDKKRSETVSLDANEFLRNTIVDRQNIGEEVAQKLDGQIISDMFGRLNRKQKQALDLRFVNELSYGEIATKLGKPVGTVGTLINRGKKMLRLELEKVGFSSRVSFNNSQ